MVAIVSWTRAGGKMQTKKVVAALLRCLPMMGLRSSQMSGASPRRIEPYPPSAAHSGTFHTQTAAFFAHGRCLNPIRIGKPARGPSEIRSWRFPCSFVDV